MNPINEPPYETPTPVDRYIQQLMNQTSPTKLLDWKALPAHQKGFSLKDTERKVVLLKHDSDPDYLKYVLEVYDSSGKVEMANIEIFKRGEEKGENLHVLYSKLEQQHQALLCMASDEDTPIEKDAKTMERLISALVADARRKTNQVITWNRGPIAVDNYHSYAANGLVPGSTISITPERIDENGTTFLFVYAVNEHVVFKLRDSAISESDSSLRQLFFAVADKDLFWDNPECVGVLKLIATLKERDFVESMLNEDENKPRYLIWDIFSQCNAGAVSRIFARTMTRYAHRDAATPERIRYYCSMATGLINRIRKLEPHPNGNVISAKYLQVIKPGCVQWDDDALRTIINSWCSIPSEFYLGMTEKCYINRTAHMLLVALLNANNNLLL